MAMASLLLFAGVARAECSIHAPARLDAPSTVTAELEDAGHGHESPGDDDCLASPVLSTIECTATDAAWLAPALLAGLPGAAASGFAEALLAGALGNGLLSPLSEPVFRRFPKLLI